MSKKRTFNVKNTSELDISLVEGLKLTFATRDEIEEGRTDIIRFDHYKSYLTPDDLKYFRDEELKQLFIKVFWNKPENILEVLENAVENYSNGKFRIKQIRDAILSQYVRDGRLII